MSEEEENAFDEIEAVIVDDDDDGDGDGLENTAIDASIAENYSVDGILTVPIEVVVSVGKAQPLIRDFLGMTRDSLLVLDSKIDDPVEVRVAGRTIARGELQEMPEQEGVLAVRLTEIVARGDS
ncbi:MAG: FliM/FliN family flagellar motor switch protein [Pseudomonadota bacterium]